MQNETNSSEKISIQFCAFTTFFLTIYLQMLQHHQMMEKLYFGDVPVRFAAAAGRLLYFTKPQQTQSDQSTYHSNDDVNSKNNDRVDLRALSLARQRPVTSALSPAAPPLLLPAIPADDLSLESRESTEEGHLPQHLMYTPLINLNAPPQKSNNILSLCVQRFVVCLCEKERA